MQVNIDKKELVEALNKVSMAVAARPMLSILANVRLDRNDLNETLRLTTTDLDSTVVASTRATYNTEDGGLAIPFKRFQALVRELPDGDISLETEGEKLSIKAQSGKYSLTGMDASNFPMCKMPTGELLQVGKMLEAMQKVGFAVEKDDGTRIALQGVNVKIEEDGIRTVAATDGRKLGMIQWKEAFTGKTVDVIIPHKILTQLFSRLKGETCQGMMADEDMVMLDFGDWVLYSRVLEGPYPDVEQVIPQGYTKWLTLETQPFLQVVKRVAVMADDSLRQVVLNIENLLEICAIDFDTGGEARESMEVTWEHEPMKVAMDSQFLVDILTHIGTEQVRIELSTPMSAMVFKPVGDETTLFLAMPQRLGD